MCDDAENKDFKFKITFEGDMFEHKQHFNTLIRYQEMERALYEIYNISRNELKHGCETTESCERALDSIKELSWFITDLVE